MRNFKQLLCSCAVMAFALASFNANAGSVDANAARAAAGKFLQQNRTTKFMKSSTSNIKLVHTEKSSVKDNAYYVFNIDGGGWVVIAGDDRAKEVLAYGTEGSIDMNAMPENMKGYLNMLKGQIETAQAYKGKTVPVKATKLSTPVEPLLKTRWGQGEPWNLLCPVNAAGQRTSVGCAPLAMAQVVYYWKYPNEVPELASYPGTGYQWYSSLPATTFDFDLILDKYRYYDPETGNPVVEDYTDEQANEVAKLSRYCGQACKSRYGNSGTSTGSYSYDQRTAFKTFGYNENLQLIGKDPSYYNDNSNKYTIEEWCELIRTELEAGHPIPYHDMWEGHAWVVDGVDADGKFHMNWGFNGKFDGWYEIDAMSFHPNGDDEVWDFSQSSNSGNEMIINCFPYEGYVIPGGDEPEVTATPVLSYDEQTRMLTVEGVGEIHVYVDGIEVEMPYQFQKTFEVATYTVTATAQEEGKSISETATLQVTVPAKQLGDINDDGFVNVADVTELINAILNSNTDTLDQSVANIDGDAYINVADVTALITIILNQ